MNIICFFYFFNHSYKKFNSYDKKIGFTHATDVLVFIHIQKTSGTYWESQVHNHLYVKINSKWTKACKKGVRHYECIKNYKNLSIYWDHFSPNDCDMHSGIAEMKRCLFNNTYKFKEIHFITWIREPVQRYISEFEFVKNGAVWNNWKPYCSNIDFNKNKCFTTVIWENLTWNEFLSCPFNTAHNRMVRMLADYSEIGCDVLECLSGEKKCNDETILKNEQAILESAKKTLVKLDFFGLTEYQIESQKMFERFFKDKFYFNANFVQVKRIHSNEFETYLSRIKEKNNLDIQLYSFAKSLFFKRKNIN